MLVVFSSRTTEGKRYIHFLPSRRAIRANILYTFVTGFLDVMFQNHCLLHVPTRPRLISDLMPGLGLVTVIHRLETLALFIPRFYLCYLHHRISFRYNHLSQTHPPRPPLSLSLSLSVVSLAPYLSPELSAVARENMLTAVC